MTAPFMPVPDFTNSRSAASRKDCSLGFKDAHSLLRV
jgi:hypothetical protein